MLPCVQLSHVYDSCNGHLLFVLLVVVCLHQQNRPDVNALLDDAHTQDALKLMQCIHA